MPKTIMSKQARAYDRNNRRQILYTEDELGELGELLKCLRHAKEMKV